jgi:inhibitor of cysteine peptidase
VRGLALGLVVVSFVGCAGRSALEEDRAYQAGLASVERIEVTVFQERPVSVHVSVYGQLPDSCTELDRSQQQRLGSGIDVTLTTRRESRTDCAAEPRPFERRILLDVVGLAPGLYSVEVNGVRESFQIFRDSSIPDPMDRLRTW